MGHLAGKNLIAEDAENGRTERGESCYSETSIAISSCGDSAGKLA